MSKQQAISLRATARQLRERADALDTIADTMDPPEKAKRGPMRITRNTDTPIDRRRGTYDPNDPHTQREMARKKAEEAERLAKRKSPRRKPDLGGLSSGG